MAFLKDAFRQIDGFIFPRRFHSRFLRMLTDDLNGALVGAEPEENGMAHLGLLLVHSVNFTSTSWE